MKVHHLNCATMCPPLGKILINDDGYMVCHCLAIETEQGLILVDTGLGEYDLANPREALGGLFVAMTRPRLDRELTAAAQVERLGFHAADVAQILITHLDLDHAGGLRDFPSAKVHVYRPEHEAAIGRRTANERRRYRPHQLAGVSFVLHEADGQGEDWFGFRAVRPLPGLDVALIPLTGHTRGHCGVAVRSRTGWILHCGDAYFHAGQMAPERESCSVGLAAFQRMMAIDNAARLANVARLRQLAREHHPEVRVFCAHDPAEFRQLSEGPPVRLFA